MKGQQNMSNAKKLAILTFILFFSKITVASAKNVNNVMEFTTEQAFLITNKEISEEKKQKILNNFYKEERKKRILSFISKHKKRLKKEKVFIFVDYSLPIWKKRFFVFDLVDEKVIFSTYVGHSGYSGDTIPFDTSNTPRTRKTSLGLYKIGNQYHGSFGKSKRLHGLSKTNSNAFRRAIVAHSMPGDSFEDLYSWGCFTFFRRDLNVAFHFMKKGRYLLAVR